MLFSHGQATAFSKSLRWRRAAGAGLAPKLWARFSSQTRRASRYRDARRRLRFAISARAALYLKPIVAALLWLAVYSRIIFFGALLLAQDHAITISLDSPSALSSGG